MTPVPDALLGETIMKVNWAELNVFSVTKRNLPASRKVSLSLEVYGF
jgi:hypothetical protein